MVQQQVVSSSSSSSSAHIFIKSRLKNPLQNFAEGEAGESRDNVAEAHPRENFRGAGGRSPRQCGRSRRPGKRLEYAKRLEQVERLKAKERMKNPRKNFSGGEAGITPRMREQTSAKIFAEVSLSLFQNSPLTHQDGPGRAEIHRG